MRAPAIFQISDLSSTTDHIEGDLGLIPTGHVYTFKDGKWTDPVDVKSRVGILRPGVAQDDGSLYDQGWYLEWKVGRKTATLDGPFTADELEAIASHMRLQTYVREFGR